MDRKEFIASYMAAFLGAHAAKIYDDVCATGEHERSERQPVEDAEFWAEKAWDSMVKAGVVARLYV